MAGSERVVLDDAALLLLLLILTVELTGLEEGESTSMASSFLGSTSMESAVELPCLSSAAKRAMRRARMSSSVRGADDDGASALSSSGSRPPRAQRAMSDGNMAIGNCCRAMLL